MAAGKTHPKEDLIRYMDKTMDESERKAIEEHLKTCKSCSEYLSFVKEFSQELGTLKKEEFSSDEPCPDSWTMVSYEAGDLDEETAKHMRVHLLFCDDCGQELDALRRLRAADESEAAGTSWSQRVEALKEFMVDLGKTYGPEAVLGSFRIMAEGFRVPSPARGLSTWIDPMSGRDRGSSKRVFKVLEVTIGDNTYNIDLEVTPDGSVSCDIAGIEAPHEAPLRIVVHAEEGKELLEAKTDDKGNTKFTIPESIPPESLFVFKLTLNSHEESLLVRLPKKASA